MQKGKPQRKNPFNPNADEKRRVTLMKRVYMVRKRGERIEVTFDEKGQPEGKHGNELMSWIAVLAREHFKETRKWEKRDGLWLESRTGKDGELKDPSYRKVGELIYNTYESQGNFESVGTKDVLTQVLSKPEHPGHTHGQSKFVKQSQYFALKRSSNRDTEVLSMRRKIEELKELVRGLCAKKDVEPSFYQENMPTVDQHNSFKASCTLQENDLECLIRQPCRSIVRSVISILSMNFIWTVACCIWKDMDGEPSHRCNPWDTTRASRGPSHVPDQAAEGNKSPKKLGKKPINSRTEVQQDAKQERPSFDFNKMNMELRPLAYYALNSIREDAGLRERADALIAFLRDAPNGRLYLVPHYRGRN
ncbi:hypothetical protein TIFTF001_043958 [Ficus carica]|uniref:Uncharacterized protein n=1 Tax=Ficus carica TaxID=3494 RepID=A0AA88CQK4_FICCA|nr:hypothetical protein TIFTF001_043958 [Ficus carica]